MFASSVTLLAGGVAFAVTKTCPENCWGSGTDDRLFGDAGANVIYAEHGDDKVVGRGGTAPSRGATVGTRCTAGAVPTGSRGTPAWTGFFGGMGDDLVRGGTPERPNDGVRDVPECGDGTDTAYFIAGQDIVKNCEILNPPE